MNILVAATGDIALPLWDWLLLRRDFTIMGLLTQPDRPQGRKMTLMPPAIKVRALAAGVPVYQPETLRKKNAIDELVALCPELIVVMAYGQMLPIRFIECARLACVNLHASLLPKYRGAACIPAAIWNGDAETGVTLMHVVKELDAGDMIASLTLPISPEDTGGSLHDKLAALAPQVLELAIADLASGNAKRAAQDPSRVSHVGKIGRDHGRIDWTKPAVEIERLIRAMHPWPSTYTHTSHGQRVKIFPPTQIAPGDVAPGQTLVLDHRFCVGTGKDLLVLGEVQPEGSKIMPVLAFARGLREGCFFRISD